MLDILNNDNGDYSNPQNGWYVTCVGIICRGPLASRKAAESVRDRLERQHGKPPLGLVPRWLWEEMNGNPTPEQAAERKQAVQEAVDRYRGFSYPVPPEWLAEVNAAPPSTGETLRGGWLPGKITTEEDAAKMRNSTPPTENSFGPSSFRAMFPAWLAENRRRESAVKPEIRYHPADDSLTVVSGETCPACGALHVMKFTPLPVVGYFEGTCPATGRSVRMVMIREAGERYIRPLQFGHGGEAVETGTNYEQVVVIDALQFGHGGEAVETARRVGNRRRPVGFNSATAVKPWRLTPDSIIETVKKLKDEMTNAVGYVPPEPKCVADLLAMAKDQARTADHDAPHIVEAKE